MKFRENAIPSTRSLWKHLFLAVLLVKNLLQTVTRSDVQEISNKEEQKKQQQERKAKKKKKRNDTSTAKPDLLQECEFAWMHDRNRDRDVLENLLYVCVSFSHSIEPITRDRFFILLLMFRSVYRSLTAAQNNFFEFILVEKHFKLVSNSEAGKRISADV